jgi:2-iminobutanoate/2-iminopropanoate deaminase
MTVTRHPLEGTTYCSAVEAVGPGRWVYTAGHVALGDDGALIDGDLAAQTERTLDNVELALARGGATLRDVVKITVYVLSLSDYASFSRVRGERFGETLPASSTVAVSDLLFGAAIEIDAVAFLPGEVA